MSAFIVSKKHIDTLVTEAGTGDGLAWRSKNSDGSVVWVRYGYERNADSVGQMLVDECIRSVSARYPKDAVEELPGPFDKSDLLQYRLSPTKPVSAVQLIKSLDCYDYQSCETDDWQDTEAFAFCEALRHKAINRLPGYEAAVWGVPGE